jgi:predicted dehydrogenase
MSNVHTIQLTGYGVRPPFFFDIHDQGESLIDVGPHLIDLVQWTLFPGQAINYRTDINVQRGKRWPTRMTLAQFRQVTGTEAFTPELAPYVQGDAFDYYCNNQVDYSMRGAQVRIRSLWVWDRQAAPEPPLSMYRGTNAVVELRQTAKENYQPEVFVVPNNSARYGATTQAVSNCIATLRGSYPGIKAEPTGSDIHISIPDQLRLGLGAHLAQCAAELLTYVKSPKSMPAYERSNLLAKHFIATKGIEIG